MLLLVNPSYSPEYSLSLSVTCKYFHSIARIFVTWLWTHRSKLYKRISTYRWVSGLVRRGAVPTIHPVLWTLYGSDYMVRFPYPSAALKLKSAQFLRTLPYSLSMLCAKGGPPPRYAVDPRIKLKVSGISRRMYVVVSHSDGKEEIRCWSSLHYFIEGALVLFDSMHTNSPFP